MNSWHPLLAGINLIILFATVQVIQLLQLSHHFLEGLFETERVLWALLILGNNLSCFLEVVSIDLKELQVGLHVVGGDLACTDIIDFLELALINRVENLKCFLNSILQDRIVGKSELELSTQCRRREVLVDTKKDQFVVCLSELDIEDLLACLVVLLCG